MRLLCLLALLSGCTPQLVLQMTPANPERAQWEQEATRTINDLETRLKRLEEGDSP